MPYVAATDAPTKTAYNILRLEVFSLNFSYFVCDSRCCVKTLVVETVVCTDDNHSLKILHQFITQMKMSNGYNILNNQLNEPIVQL